MFAMINFLRVGRTPRLFAASMAGLRQGLAPLHPQGRNAVEDGADRRLLLREECVAHAGEETLGEPLQQGGKRRSRPLPTKAIDEDVSECGLGQSYTKEIWQGSGRAFNVWLTDY
jgi:hypothetical protein